MSHAARGLHPPVSPGQGMAVRRGDVSDSSGWHVLRACVALATGRGRKRGALADPTHLYPALGVIARLRRTPAGHSCKTHREPLRSTHHGFSLPTSHRVSVLNFDTEWRPW